MYARNGINVCLSLIRSGNIRVYKANPKRKQTKYNNIIICTVKANTIRKKQQCKKKKNCLKFKYSIEHDMTNIRLLHLLLLEW